MTEAFNKYLEAQRELFFAEYNAFQEFMNKVLSK
jgi:hypothetical protein